MTSISNMQEFWVLSMHMSDWLWLFYIAIVFLPPISGTLNAQDFCNFNRVWLVYCDGNSFSGNRDAPVPVKGAFSWICMYMHVYSSLENTLPPLYRLIWFTFLRPPLTQLSHLLAYFCSRVCKVWMERSSPCTSVAAELSTKRSKL